MFLSFPTQSWAKPSGFWFVGMALVNSRVWLWLLMQNNTVNSRICTKIECSQNLSVVQYILHIVIVNSLHFPFPQGCYSLLVDISDGLVSRLSRQNKWGCQHDRQPLALMAALLFSCPPSANATLFVKNKYSLTIYLFQQPSNACFKIAEDLHKTRSTKDRYTGCGVSLDGVCRRDAVCRRHSPAPL